MSGEILTEVVARVGPLLTGQKNGKSSGSVLLGTVSGDIHDIGKNIAGMLLTCYGFTVTDLGVDVPPADFTAKALEIKPDIVGLSGLITSSFEMMRKTITALRAEAKTHGLKFRIVIGGATVDDQVCHFVGADDWVTDAMAGVRLCQKYVESSKR
jgi:dimethylamine corrinoid protein